MTDEPNEAGEPDAADESAPVEPPDGPAKLTKAQKLEAKAARLREADERRAEQRRAAAEAGSPTPPSRGWIVATAVLGVVTAGLVAVLIVGYLSWQHQRDVNTARAGALKAAQTFALDFGAYDYQHLDADFAKAAARMSPSFAKDYTQTSKKIEPTLVQYKTQVTARVQGAGVTSASIGKAVVVLFLDQTVKTSQSSVPRIDRNRLQITLQKEKGKWLVSKLDAK